LAAGLEDKKGVVPEAKVPLYGWIVIDGRAVLAAQEGVCRLAIAPQPVPSLLEASTELEMRDFCRW